MCPVAGEGYQCLLSIPWQTEEGNRLSWRPGFFFFLATLRGMWDLSSLTLETRSVNHWTTGEVPGDLVSTNYWATVLLKALPSLLT